MSYELVEPFDVDNGELDGVRQQVVFCLGVEWQMISALLNAGGPIRRTIHTENVSRIKRMCIRRGRTFRIEPCPDCPAEWHFLEVD